MTSLICILAALMLSAAPTVTKPKVTAPAKRHLKRYQPPTVATEPWVHPERQVNSI